MEIGLPKGPTFNEGRVSVSRVAQSRRQGVASEFQLALTLPGPAIGSASPPPPARARRQSHRLGLMPSPARRQLAHAGPWDGAAGLGLSHPPTQRHRDIAVLLRWPPLWRQRRLRQRVEKSHQADVHGFVATRRVLGRRHRRGRGRRHRRGYRCRLRRPLRPHCSTRSNRHLCGRRTTRFLNRARQRPDGLQRVS